MVDGVGEGESVDSGVGDEEGSGMSEVVGSGVADGEGVGVNEEVRLGVGVCAGVGSGDVGSGVGVSRGVGVVEGVGTVVSGGGTTVMYPGLLRVTAMVKFCTIRVTLYVPGLS
jgi:hypothetical protein